MEKWFGQQEDYLELKVFECLAFAHVRQDKLESKAIRYTFIGYLEGVKGYKLFSLEKIGKMCFVSRYAVFNEEKMEELVKYDSKALSCLKYNDISIEVESSGATNKSDNKVQETKDITDDATSVPEETEQEIDPLTNYQLEKDRKMRQIIKPVRWVYADLTSCAFSVDEDIELEEPKSYKKICKSTDKKQWLKVMNEEMFSLKKNRTWVLLMETPVQ